MNKAIGSWANIIDLIFLLITFQSTPSIKLMSTRLGRNMAWNHHLKPIPCC